MRKAKTKVRAKVRVEPLAQPSVERVGGPDLVIEVSNTNGVGGVSGTGKAGGTNEGTIYLEMADLLVQRGAEMGSKRRRAQILGDEGFTTSHIAKFLGVSYQQAYNNIHSPRSAGVKGDIAVCLDCGKPLIDDESVDSGRGPICRRRHEQMNHNEVVFGLARAGVFAPDDPDEDEDYDEEERLLAELDNDPDEDNN